MAIEYLLYAACIHRKDIHIELLARFDSDTEGAIRVLHSYMLATRRPAEFALDLHQVVRFFVRKCIQKIAHVEMRTQIASMILATVFSQKGYRDKNKRRCLLPHAKYALSYSPTNQVELARLPLLNKFSLAMYYDGRLQEAEALFLEAIEIAEKMLGNGNQRTLTIMTSLVSTYSDNGKSKESEQLFIWIIKIQKRVLGDRHPQKLTNIRGPEATYIDQSRWKEAEEIFIQQLRRNLEVQGDRHDDMIGARSHLAVVYLHQDRLRKAEDIQVQVLRSLLKVNGNEHPDTLMGMKNLSST